jgi:TPR repeat protein/tRNA A-37 threonylcarbamoyl transferase component Bud32
MTSAAVLAPGTVFAGDYTIVRPLSEGGMGALYVVQQLSTGAQRALKLMHPQLVREPRLRQRFEQEARVGARIESDHVVQVLGAGVDEPSGMPWLVMELLHGQDLSRVIEQRGPLPPAEVREIFAQFTHAVAAAHRVGIVHRDLKPENIFVAVSQREGMDHLVKVLDFGIAKVVAEAKATATQALGTPIWMAPEQTEAGRSILPAADVWSLGLIAFRMLTGKHFWISANSEEATPTMVLREAIIDPIVGASARAQEYGRANLLPPGFDAWFARCVVRQPQERFENAGAARDAFAALMGGAPVSAPTASAPALSPPAQRTVAAAPAGFTPVGAHTPVPAGFTPVGAHAPVPAGFTPVGAHAPMGAAPGPSPPAFGAGGPTQVGGPYLAAPPPPPARAKSSGGGAGIAAVLVVLVLGGAGLGLRALSRSHKIKDCESGKGDDLLAACLVACASDAAKFCVTHGDLARTRGDAASLEDATRSYEKACKAEDWLGCRKLGAQQELEKNEPAALESFTKSCDGKNASGCAYLARRLDGGRGIARDAARAAALFESACAEDPASCAFLAFSAENRPARRPDRAELDALHAKAAPALRTECASGGLVECVALGTLLQGGRGVETDVPAAMGLFRKACESGLAEGCNNAAVLEVMGPDAGKNVGKATESLRKACAAGTVAACNNLAVVQANVPFTTRQEQGVTLLVPTCTESLSLGCTQSGVLVPAPGGPRDLPGAVAALTKACADGLGVACENLGAFQESGFGVAHDPAAALASYTRACASGAPDGCGTMKESPFQGGEVWIGTYTCGQGVTEATLRILEPSSDQRVSAVFDFDYGHGQITGRFLASGAYDAGKASIAFTPGIWLEQPPGWVTVGFSGHVSLQKTIFAGKMENPSCTGFRLARAVSDMVPPRCPSGARFVERHGCVPVPRPGPNLVGAWNGRGTEASGASWLMTGTLKSLESGRCGQVSYPSLGCAGDWYCVKSSDGKKLRAREIITTGQGRCDSTGFVEMTLSDDAQSADWRWSSPVRAQGSTAHLARVPGP